MLGLLPLVSLFQNGTPEGDAGASALIVLIELAIAILVIAAMWRIFSKAGQPGWAAIIPIYNAYVLLKVAGRPGWWLLLCLIPFVNLVVLIVVMVDLAKAFGKGTGFALGLIFLSVIFLPILGFGSAQYVGRPTLAPAA